MEYFWITLVIATASIIKGITGFGFAMVSLPLLMIWYSPKELIPVLLIGNLASSVIIVLQKKERKLVNKQFRSLIIFGALFTIIGTITLKHISENKLIFILGIFFFLLSVLSLFGKQYSIKQTGISYKIAGAILGFLTGSTSVSGPPMALFLNASYVDKQEFREIFSWFNIVTASIALVGYGVLGLLTPWTFKMAAVFLPILFLGSYFGKKLNYVIPSLLFKRISMLLTLCSSVLLLLRLKI